MQTKKPELLTLTVEIIAAFLSRNAATFDQVPPLIKAIHATFACLAEPKSPPKPKSRQEPAVPISDSIAPDRLICLECGREHRLLKLHLERAHALTVQSYREKWALPYGYPMAAPTLSVRRKTLAEEVQLGQYRRGQRRRVAK
jgi:predicted transcriptional regulator